MTVKQFYRNMLVLWSSCLVHNHRPSGAWRRAREAIAGERTVVTDGHADCVCAVWGAAGSRSLSEMLWSPYCACLLWFPQSISLSLTPAASHLLHPSHGCCFC